MQIADNDMKGVIAGYPTSTSIAAYITILYVKSYLDGFKGLALEHPIYVRDLPPVITFSAIDEPTAAQRQNNYAAFIKKLRKNKHATQDG